MSRNAFEIEWSKAGQDDAAEMAAIYNESVVHGSRVPGFGLTSATQVKAMLIDLQDSGYVAWCFWHHETLVGWCSIGQLGWGGGGTIGTVELSIYVTEEWLGKGVGAQAVFLAYSRRRSLGLKAVTCWVLRGNRLSRNLAHGVRLERWGILPQVVEHGDQCFDVEIWGKRLDDVEWCGYMDALAARLSRHHKVWLKERSRTPIKHDFTLSR